MPLSWNQYFIIFIDKPGNKGYRPIALASCVLKILERIINDRMQWWFEYKRLIPRNFFGFRRAKSCSDSLATLYLDILNARKRGHALGVIFLDIIGAYDNVNLEVLINILQKYNVPEIVVRFIKNIINNRSFAGFYNGVHFASGATNRGLPQGSIISPLLFNIYIMDIVEKVDPDIKIISFADDICIYSSQRDLNFLKALLTENISRVDRWLTTLNLSISFDKTHFMLFGSDRNPFDPGTQIITTQNGHILANKEVVRYLGVLWDYRLKWSSHILSIRDASRRLLNMLKSVAGFNWGAHPETLLLIYKTIIRPKMDWGCFLFADSTNRFKQALDVVQNSALRISLECLRTTPINVLHHLSGIELLSIRR